MKARNIAFLAVVAAAGAGVVFQSCGESSSSKEAATTTTETPAEQDVTQAFTVAITGASVDFPAGALEAGTKVSFVAGTQPSEFAVESIVGASVVGNLSAVDAAGAAVTQTKAPFTLALDIAAAAALHETEKTAANLCVLVKGADGTVRKWANANLTIDEAGKKVTLKGLWLGVFQALYCGDHFADVPVVNAAGDGVEEKSKPEVEVVTTSKTTDGTCNTLKLGGETMTSTPVSGTIPVGEGGTIVDGTYVLTAFKTYTGSPIQNKTGKQRLEIAGEEAQFVATDGDAAAYHESFTLKPSGTVPNLVRTCSTAEDDAVTYSSYTATATTFTIYHQQYGFSFTYTKE